MRHMLGRILASLAAIMVVIAGALLVSAPAQAADRVARELAVTGQDGGGALTIGIIALVIIVAGVLFLVVRKRTPKE